MRAVKDHWLLLTLLSSTFLLRFIPLFNYQFTFDELSGLDRTQFNSYADLLERGVKIDAHPALVQLIIYWLVKLVGFNTAIIKLPFLLAGQLTIIYAYAIGYRFFSHKVAQIAAVFFSFSLVFVFYAPIARMYSSGVFFSLAAIYYVFRLADADLVKPTHYILFVLFAWLSALNHHINALFVFTLAVAGLFMLPANRRWYFVLACFAAALLYLPHLPITLYQLSIPGIGVNAGGWLSPPKWHAGWDFIKVLVGTGYLHWLVFFIILVNLTVFRKTLSKKSQTLLLLFLINYAIVYTYSVLRSPIFQYSVMLFAGAALLIVLAELMSYTNIKLHYAVIVILSAALITQTYIKKNYLQEAVKTIYEYQFERTSQLKQQYGDSQVYPIFFDCDTLMRKIYFKKYNTNFKFTLSADTIINGGYRSFAPNPGNIVSNDSVVSTLRMFSEFVRNCNSNYMVLSSATPLYQMIVKQFYPYLIENKQTQAINFKVYSKSPMPVVADDEVLYISTTVSPAKTNYPSKELPFIVDNKNEFPYKCSSEYCNVAFAEGEYLLSEFEIKTSSPPSNELELVMSLNRDDDDLTLSYSGKAAGDYCWRKDSTVTVFSDMYVGVNHVENTKKSTLNTFIWNRGKQQFSILKIRNFTINYWPQKWNWWL